MIVPMPQPMPGQMIELYVFDFGSEAEMLAAKQLIEDHDQSGSTGPIVLPNGDQITLDPYILWFIQQMVVRVNTYLLLLSVIR